MLPPQQSARETAAETAWRKAKAARQNGSRSPTDIIYKFIIPYFSGVFNRILCRNAERRRFPAAAERQGGKAAGVFSKGNKGFLPDAIKNYSCNNKLLHPSKMLL